MASGRWTLPPRRQGQPSRTSPWTSWPSCSAASTAHPLPPSAAPAPPSATSPPTQPRGASSASPCGPPSTTSSCRATAGVHYRALFADAFPFPASSPPPPPPPPPSPCRLPARLISSVDLHYNGACIMSRVVETDADSDWFLGSPFRIDALVQEGFSAPSPITPANLSLSWILLDPATGRAVNASSRRPVAVDRKWLTGHTVTSFAVVLAGVAMEAAVTCDERRGHVREVSLCVVDGDGSGVNGRDGLGAVAAAMAGGRRGGEGAARRRYEEFVAGKRARKEWKERREGMLDLCCSGVGAAAFVGFVVMLTLR